MTPRQVTTVLVAVLIGAYIGMSNAKADPPALPAQCFGLPMVGPGGIEKGAATTAELVEKLRTSGRSTIAFGGPYVCGW